MDSQRRSSLRLKRDDDKSGHQTEPTATTDSQRRSKKEAPALPRTSSSSSKKQKKPKFELPTDEELLVLAESCKNDEGFHILEEFERLFTQEKLRLICTAKNLAKRCLAQVKVKRGALIRIKSVQQQMCWPAHLDNFVRHFFLYSSPLQTNLTLTLIPTSTFNPTTRQ